MKAVSTLPYACAVAFGLTATACSTAPEDPAGPDPMAMRAVSYMHDDEGNFHCNFSVIGPNLALTSRHCMSGSPYLFTVQDSDGRIHQARDGNQASPGIAWINQQEENADATLLEDIVFMRAAKDKSIVLLTDNIGDDSGTLPLTSLDTLTWKPMADHPGFFTTDLTLITHWPGKTPKDAPEFYTVACQGIRHETITEIIAHTCPTRDGVSGSPLVTYNKDEPAIVAIIYGDTTRGYDSELTRLFATAIDTREINYAATVNSMAALCEEIKNCRAQRSDNGHVTLALTN